MTYHQRRRSHPKPHANPPLLALLLAPGLSLVALPAATRAAEQKADAHAGHTANADVPIPATAAGVWTEINEHHRKLTEMMTARQLKEADPPRG